MNYVQTPVVHLHYAFGGRGAHGNLHLKRVQVAGSQISCATRWQQVFPSRGCPRWERGREVENRAAAPGLLHIAT